MHMFDDCVCEQKLFENFIFCKLRLLDERFLLPNGVVHTWIRYGHILLHYDVHIVSLTFIV